MNAQTEQPNKIKKSSADEQKKESTQNERIIKWFLVSGDLDDFIFYDPNKDNQAK